MSVTERELRLLRVVRHVTSAWQLGTIPREVRHESRSGGGNPYHDPETGQFTGPGGGGSSGKRRRRRRKGRRRAALRRKREAIRKEYKAWAKQLKKEHRASHRDAVKGYRKTVRDAKREYARERAAAIREGKKGIASGESAGERNEAREFTRIRLDQAKDQYRDERKSARADLKGELAGQKEFRREEWAEFRDKLRSDVDDLRDEFGLPEKSRGEGRSVERRLSPGRIHKASSAEAILRHVLRGRGWTRAFRRGDLAGEQHLEVLEDVRQYGRAWLRHEAEAFARAYLGAGPQDRGVGRAIPASLAANLGRFFRRAKQFVRELIVAATWGLTGPAPMTGEELQEAEREAVRQDAFFDRFYSEVEFWGKPAPRPETPTAARPPMTPPEFVARVEKYADSSWQAAQRINRKAALDNPRFKVERLVMGIPKTEHCHECPVDAAKGWVPIGTLKPIGERECEQLCLCHFRYADSPDGQAYVQGRRTPIPAPREPVQVLPDSEGGDVEMVAEPPGQAIDAPIAGPPGARP